MGGKTFIFNVQGNVLASRPKVCTKLHRASERFLSCDEFNTLVEDKVKWSEADWHCSLRASQLISQKDQYGREVSEQKWGRQMFMSEFFFFFFFYLFLPNTNHLAPQENKCESRPTTFYTSRWYIHTEKAHPCCWTSGRIQCLKDVKAKNVKVVLHYARLRALIAEVHSNHKALIAAHRGRKWRVT